MDTWPSVLPAREGLVAFAHELAEHARELVLPHFRETMTVSYKTDASPVTEVDRRVERALRKQILARFPAHGVIGEEFGSGQREGAPCWIIDPIDGTKAFITGRPLFGTLIGLLLDDAPVMGVLEASALGERWLGASGMVSEVNGTPCLVSDVRTLAEAKLSATTIDMFDGAARRAFDELGAAVRFRTFGGDCHAYGTLASGFLDLVVEAGLQPYDYLPLVPIVAGAGGVMTDWASRPLTLGSSGGQVIAAANRELHQQACDLLHYAAAL